MTRPIRFAVVGCGMLAQSQHLPNIVRSSRMMLQVCCDLSDENLTACRESFRPERLTHDYHDAMNDPAVDAICLATTEKLRLPVIEAAAEAGKPIYVEKPLAQSLEEVLCISQIVKASKIPFCVGHNRRSAPAMLEARRIFRKHMSDPQPCPWRFDREGAARPTLPDDGVATMSVRVNDDWYSWKRWVFDSEQAPHGPMLFEMTHFTDLCNWFLDAEPVEVAAFETGRLNSVVAIRYATGELASITMCANGTFGYPKELYEIMGHGAVVVVDHMLELRTAGIAGVPARLKYTMRYDPCPDVGGTEGFDAWFEKKKWLTQWVGNTKDPKNHVNLGPQPDKGHAHALDRFVDEIHGVGSQVCGIDDAVSATRVAFAAIRSACEGRMVRIDEA